MQLGLPSDRAAKRLVQLQERPAHRVLDGLLLAKLLKLLGEDIDKVVVQELRKPVVARDVRRASGYSVTTTTTTTKNRAKKQQRGGSAH